MCTAISSTGACHLFGRTLDLEFSYGESVITTPRDFAFKYIYENMPSRRLAMIGTAHLSDGVPLYYDAANEAGLAAAALRFPELAVYHNFTQGKHNVASFELIPWLLGQCSSLKEARKLLERTNVTPHSFSEKLTATPLHWLISDKSGSIAAEPTENGLMIYDALFGVLTNAPEFPFHTDNAEKYLREKKLPGEFCSQARFVRAVYANSHTQKGETKEEQISGFFHVMESVSQPKGCSLTKDKKPICTVYTSCADTQNGDYYFTTYSCRRIRRVSLTDTAKQSNALSVFPMDAQEDILNLNSDN